MNRLFIKGAVLLALVLTGWWWLATSSLQRGIQSWMAARTLEGTETRADAIMRTGFPVRIGAAIDTLALQDPLEGITLTIPRIEINAPIYWPGHATVTLGPRPIQIFTPQEAIEIGYTAAKAEVRLRPIVSLQLAAMEAVGRDLTLSTSQGQMLGLAAVEINVRQSTEERTYDGSFVATGLELGKAVQQAFDLPATWPVQFEPAVAEASITFDRPWDRSALGITRPQARMLRIDRLATEFGEIGILAQAQLDIDAQGVPTGAVQFEIRNWQQLFGAAFPAGVQPPQWATTAQGVMALFSDAQGTLNLEISLEAGQMRVGFIPLGPAPRLVIP
jgi:hypothetical protein